MIVTTIPGNISNEELLNQISMDPNATEREKFLMQRFEESIEEQADFDSERHSFDCQISSLQDEVDIAEKEILDLKVEIKELKQEKEQSASAAIG